ncbi:MAG: hypothetical protein ABIR68_06685 [Ilumatobacteraceae bacterium]
MTPALDRSSSIAARLATVGGCLGVVAGVVQATAGSRLPQWTGNKDSPFALGLLTMVLSISVVVVVARSVAKRPPLRPEALSAIALWFMVVAVLCSTTVGWLSVVPAALILIAAGAAIAGLGWRAFTTVVRTHWLRGLLCLLGGFELLMAVSAAPVVTIVAGLVAGGALITAAIIRPDRRTASLLLVAASLPFAALTWWTIVSPSLTVTALVICLSTPDHDDRSAGGQVQVGMFS